MFYFVVLIVVYVFVRVFAWDAVRCRGYIKHNNPTQKQHPYIAQPTDKNNCILYISSSEMLCLSVIKDVLFCRDGVDTYYDNPHLSFA